MRSVSLEDPDALGSPERPHNKTVKRTVFAFAGRGFGAIVRKVHLNFNTYSGRWGGVPCLVS